MSPSLLLFLPFRGKRVSPLVLVSLCLSVCLSLVSVRGKSCGWPLSFVLSFFSSVASSLFLVLVLFFVPSLSRLFALKTLRSSSLFSIVRSFRWKKKKEVTSLLEAKLKQIK